MPRYIDGLTMRQWIERETRKRKTSWWGQPCYIKPVIHPEKFGDGLQLCYLGTIDQRPNYWLIRIDSSIDVHAGDFNYEYHLLNPVEDHFGRYPDHGYMTYAEFRDLKRQDKRLLQEYCNYKDYISDCKYPRLSWSGGHWGSIVNFKTGEKN